MGEKFRRINVILQEEQYKALSARGLNVSGLIRDLVGDYLAKNTITLQVSDETRRIYDAIVSNTGSNDSEIEQHLRQALKGALENRITEMQSWHKKLAKK